MLSFTTIIFTITLFSSHIYAASNCVTVTQTKSNSWTSGSQTFSQWQVKLENTASTVAKDVTLSFSPALADSYEIVKQANGEYTLPTWLVQNGGIQPQASHSFGYTIQSATSATISINCGGSSSPSTPAPTPKPTPKPTPFPTDPTPTPRATPSPTPTSTPTTTPTVPPSVPVTPTSTPTVAPSSAPTTSPSAATTHCDIVFVVDNYIMRQTTLSDSEIIAKYTNYFKDVQSFYRDHFNMEMRISSFYLEKDGSFSDTMDENVLLDNFRSGLLGNFFPGVPASACVYHLITGRDLFGIGGLAWVGTACGINTFNLGLTVDLNGVEDGTSVIRRLTHEIGHTLGGQHFDFYQADLLYTCSATPDDSERRILRKENQNDKREAYQFLADDLHFTQCATSTIRNSVSSFSCLWDEYKATVPAHFTLYSESNYGGDSNVIPAYNGVQACYNILYPHAGTLSSYQVADSGSSTFRIAGVKFFSHNDCVGDSFDLGLSSSFVGASNDKKALSYMFIRA